MKTRSGRILVPVAVALLPLVASATAQEERVDAESETDSDEEVTHAPREGVERLLARHRKAVREKDAARITEVLLAMSDHDNEEFLAAALSGLGYEASRLDRREARREADELGTTSKKEVEALLLRREVSVQEAAATVLGNLPGKKTTKVLAKFLKNKKARKGRPVVTAAVIRSLGRLQVTQVEEDVERQLGQSSSKEITRACVRYFGQIESKSFSVVKKLIDLLDPPQPLDVNDPKNPPAQYWAVRAEQWAWSRRDVVWSLERITGQVFRAADGEHDSDAHKALMYVKEHKKELGLR